jgi:hypothetical protein
VIVITFSPAAVVGSGVTTVVLPGVQPVQGVVVGQQGVVVGQQGVVCGQQGVVCGQQGVVCGQQGVVCGQQGVVCGQQPPLPISGVPQEHFFFGFHDKNEKLNFGFLGTLCSQPQPQSLGLRWQLTVEETHGASAHWHPTVAEVLCVSGLRNNPALLGLQVVTIGLPHGSQPQAPSLVTMVSLPVAGAA